MEEQRKYYGEEGFIYYSLEEKEALLRSYMIRVELLDELMKADSDG